MAALVLSLFGVASASANVANGGSVLDRVAKIRTAIERQKMQTDGRQGTSPIFNERLAQWGNWPNWGNWGNWNNWRNWANWGNWGNG